MSSRVGWQSGWDGAKDGLRRVGRLLGQGTLQQKVLLWIGLAGIAASVLLALQELWRCLPAVIGVVLIGYALRARGPV